MNTLSNELFPHDGDTVYSFLMAGQSNMAGRGPLEGAPVIANDLCLMLRMGRWMPMSEPVNVDRCPLPGFGVQSGASMAPRFAQLFAETYHCKIGLIPSADGGTTIEQWQPGTVLFDHAIMQAKLAMRSSTFSGILWHQGESNATSMEQVDDYAEKFLRTMDAFREELGEVPIIVGEIGRPEHGFSPQYAEPIRYFNRKLRETIQSLPFCRMADSEGLVSKGDGLHFDTPSQRIFGARYFEAYTRLLAENGLSAK